MWLTGMFDFNEDMDAANTVLVSPWTITVSGLIYDRIFDSFIIISPICWGGLDFDIFRE